MLSTNDPEPEEKMSLVTALSNVRWAERRAVSADAILAIAHGRPTLDTMRLVAPQYATPEEAAALDAEEAAEEGGETPVPGAAALLASLPADR